jgi:hypothetical protein
MAKDGRDHDDDLEDEDDLGNLVITILLNLLLKAHRQQQLVWI